MKVLILFSSNDRDILAVFPFFSPKEYEEIIHGLNYYGWADNRMEIKTVETKESPFLNPAC